MCYLSNLQWVVYYVQCKKMKSMECLSTNPQQILQVQDYLQNLLFSPKVCFYISLSQLLCIQMSLFLSYIQQRIPLGLLIHFFVLKCLEQIKGAFQ